MKQQGRGPIKSSELLFGGTGGQYTFCYFESKVPLLLSLILLIGKVCMVAYKFLLLKQEGRGQGPGFKRMIEQ